jgi:hypothetical protein
VALHRNADGLFECYPINILSNACPTYILGRTPRTEMETLSWFQDPQRTVFCLPAKTIGPDMILVLRLLSDLTHLRVLVQIKQLTENTIGPQDTRDAFRTTDPKQFIMRVLVCCTA